MINENKSIFRTLKVLMILSIVSLIPCVFKYLHWPWSFELVLLIFGTMSGVLFALANQSIQGANQRMRILWFVGWISMMLTFVGNLFFVWHFPGGSLLNVIGFYAAIPLFLLMTFSLKNWSVMMRWALALWGLLPELVFMLFRYLMIINNNRQESSWQPAIDWSVMSQQWHIIYEWYGRMLLSYSITLAVCAIVMLVVIRRCQKSE